MPAAMTLLGGASIATVGGEPRNPMLTALHLD
jgi:hypothetical protein